VTRMIRSLYLKAGSQTWSGLVSDVNVPGLEPTVWDGSTDANIVADVPTGQRKINVTARQDWADVAGFCQFLADNEGESVEFVWAINPDDPTPAYFAVTAVVSAPTHGGKINAYGEFTGAWPCSKPARTVAPV
jgi:hypothetical protein